MARAFGAASLMLQRPMTTRRRILVLLACCLVGVAVPLGLGLSYGKRLSSAEGFYSVAVADEVTPSGFRRPRRATLVVFDGLGHEEAQGMRSLARLAEAGQCRVTDVGSLSISRPVYAVLSTGLEADRAGVRGNDDPGPIAAESVWQVAREAGLVVTGVSELPWWQELFPAGFDAFEVLDRSVNYFQRVRAGDLQLIHPLYIDEAGHDAGAASARYGQAVARADRELEAFMAGVDLTRDLVVVTADHGHSLRGGHGGQQERIARVLTCYAGVGVRHEPAPGPLRSTTIAPSLALLLGLRFPANMRAGDDDLGALWELVDPAAFPPEYLAGRWRSVERFRAENQAEVQRWLPETAGSWDRFHAEHRLQQLRAAAPVLALLALVLALHAAAHRRLARASGAAGGGLFGAMFVISVYGMTYALQVGLHGSFDITSIAHRHEFIAFTLTLGLFASAGAMLSHLLLRRSLDALLLDLAAASLVGTLLCVAHPAALGWKVGFPVPVPELVFFPYFSALFLAAFNGVGLLVCAIGWRLQRGAR